jgi:uncharacterized repeat protein (TIGR03803 family)
MRKAFLCAMVVTLGFGVALGQAQYKVLYNFGSVPNDGLFGIYSLVADAAGNLYGLTLEGGTMNGGTVFELSPTSGGSWIETTLYNFCPNNLTCPDGSSPGGLAIDSKGNLYGTTFFGGQSSCPVNGSALGCGVVFELSPPTPQGGSWTYVVLYNFCSVLSGGACEDGTYPVGAPIFDKSGNLYGATEGGGPSNGGGVVFELLPTSGGWTETVLYGFCSIYQNGYCLDGDVPYWGPTFDKSGNLYGTTAGGGNPTSYSGGTIYRLSPASGSWTETVLYAAPPARMQGINDLGPVSIDPTGNLYTTLTSEYGQTSGNGAVGSLSPDGKVRAFFFDGMDGRGAWTGVLVDSKRHVLYGTTGVWPYFTGNVFQLDSLGHETVLYSFCSQPDCADGYNPGGLLEDKLGNLYGITLYGGNQGEGYGVVFELTP